MPQPPPADLTPLVRLTVAVCRNDWDGLTALGETAVTDRRWREALLQVHLFAGFPAVVEAFTRLGRVDAVGEVVPQEAALEPDRHERGRGLFERIYGAHGTRSRVLAGAHPELRH
ncbi:MAG: hypothetical protein R3F34_20280 [Planctomycetota bacterium]